MDRISALLSRLRWVLQAASNFLLHKRAQRCQSLAWSALFSVLDLTLMIALRFDVLCWKPSIYGPQLADRECYGYFGTLLDIQEGPQRAQGRLATSPGAPTRRPMTVKPPKPHPRIPNDFPSSPWLPLRDRIGSKFWRQTVRGPRTYRLLFYGGRLNRARISGPDMVPSTFRREYNLIILWGATEGDTRTHL